MSKMIKRELFHVGRVWCLWPLLRIPALGIEAVCWRSSIVFLFGWRWTFSHTLLNRHLMQCLFFSETRNYFPDIFMVHRNNGLEPVMASTLLFVLGKLSRAASKTFHNLCSYLGLERCCRKFFFPIQFFSRLNFFRLVLLAVNFLRWFLCNPAKRGNCMIFKLLWLIKFWKAYIASWVTSN